MESIMISSMKQLMLHPTVSRYTQIKSNPACFNPREHIYGQNLPATPGTRENLPGF